MPPRQGIALRRPEANGFRVRSFEIERGATLQTVTRTLRPAEDYEGREGYQAAFLGKGDRSVPLPKLADPADAAPVKGGGVELRYEHFSVVQSKKRRMCFFSACNLDGAQSQKAKRSNTWRYDPRISSKYQLIDECYGNAGDGLFSRGHMTRREDPVWGPNKAVAEEDTFHATNAVPQMQGHNSPVWLGLEDHVLRHADEDDQKVTVITGPVLDPKDPVLYDVKVPVQLWKIVAFVHPTKKRLAAVAYLDSQAEFLPAATPSYVWGQFKGMQVPIARVAKLTHLEFPKLEDADVLRDAGMSFSLGVNRVEDVIFS